MKTTIILAIISTLCAFAALAFGLFNQFLILKQIHATELMWFLFWANVPLSIVLQLCGKLSETLSNKVGV